MHSFPDDSATFPFRNPALPSEQRVEDLLRRLTLDEKIDLLGGVDNFYTRAINRLGLPAFKMSDGPVGVRNDGPAIAYPAGIALAATWDVDLARKYGAALGRDSRARGVHFLLGPGVNIYRVPQCGRNFEYFGEDPFLAARMAVAYIRGVQDQGVAATVKHFAANNHEHDRGHDSSEVDARTLNEIYFPAFRAAVEEAGVWAVMCSYNRLNGTYTSAHDELLNQVLKKEWGFPGLVMSDWGAAHETPGCVNGGLDLEMPSGVYMNRRAIQPLLKSGLVRESTLDDKVRRILRPAFALGWLDRLQRDPTIPIDDMPNAAVALETARAGIVLLKNKDHALPLDRAAIRTVAVIGPNAHPAVTGGGGSSFTEPVVAISALDGIRYKAGPVVRVMHVPADAGAHYQRWFAESRYVDAWQGEYFNNRDLAGAPERIQADARIDFDWGDRAPAPGIERNHFSVRWTGRIRPEESGEHLLVLRSDDGARLRVDGRTVIDMWYDHAARAETARLDLEAGRTYELQIDYYEAGGAAVVQFGWGRPQPVLPDDAREAVAAADAAVVCVGFNPSLETEGIDRPFALPDGQDELIAAVAAANPRTIVVLNAGGAVNMTRWLDHVPAVLHAWYPGQSGGSALAEILFGDVNPSGRLPASFENRWEDAAAFGNFPAVDGKLHYREGIFVGYRHFDARGIEPQFPFGHGLSYTSFEYSDLRIEPDSLRVQCAVANTGDREGAEVAQLYISDVAARVERPPKELKGFRKLRLKPGERQTVEWALDRAALAFYDPASKAWVVEPGEFEVLVGSSSRDIRLRGRFRIDAP